jgi:hypothetical protein
MNPLRSLIEGFKAETLVFGVVLQVKLCVFFFRIDEAGGSFRYQLKSPQIPGFLH